jgi:DivIVA domain-containing protein
VFVLEVLVAVAVLAAVAFAAAGRFDGLADEEPDDPDVGVPVDRPLRSDDIPRLRFRLAIRGYRMSDVDAAMAAVQEALWMNETQPMPSPPPAPPPPPAPTPPPTPIPPFEPEPLPQPEPPLAVTAEQPPTDAVERPLSELEAASRDARPDDTGAGPPPPT